MNDLPDSAVDRDTLIPIAADMSEKCIRCGICADDCLFLKRYGLPGEISHAILADKYADFSFSFSCSLCGLCHAVCPVGLAPDQFFLNMRRVANSLGYDLNRRHQSILNYQKRGGSNRYAWQGFIQDGSVVFFPGCTFSGTRPELTLQLFHTLKHIRPDLGMVMDCCAKPSHDLGLQDDFEQSCYRLLSRLSDCGVTEIWVVCPNCYKTFSMYAGHIKIRSVYEVLAESPPAVGYYAHESTVHDPCPLRFDDHIHDAVRSLLDMSGADVQEMPHSRKNTICCGEGGTVMAVEPIFARSWVGISKEQAGKSLVVTYCAGCVGFLSPHMRAVHLLDLIFATDRFKSGRLQIKKAPFTYWHRIMLKKKMSRMEKRVNVYK